MEMERATPVVVTDFYTGLNIYILPETLFLIRPADLTLPIENLTRDKYSGDVTEIIIVTGPIRESVFVRGSTDEINSKF